MATWGSFGLERLHLNPGEGWQGMTVTATFLLGDNEKTMVADADGMVDVPPQALAEAGNGVIVFSGDMAGAQRITADIRYKVIDHSEVRGDVPEPTPDAFHQYIEQTNQYREEAAESAASAAASAQQAAESADGAAGSAEKAGKYADNAYASANVAALQATNAKNSAAAAADSAAAAAASAAEAAGSEASVAADAEAARQAASAAEASETAAANSASAAKTSETNAAASKTAAASSATAAAESAGEAADSAGEAAASKTAAAGSASAASASASAAKTSETNAASSKTAAASSASAASASASAAKTSEANAASSKTAAANSATAAAESAGEAADSATAAAASKTAAASSASAAKTSETNAASSKTAAANSATAAASSAVEAADSAAAAADSAAAAAASAAEAEDIANVGEATPERMGLMSPEDKAKLDGIAEGANKTTVDSALSSTSTNPVQNKAVQAALATGAITTYQHRKTGSTHHFIGHGPNGRAQMTADVEAGDSVVLSDTSVEVTVEGKTTQAGTGDPSPDNIRMIDGVGMYDQCVVLDGSEDEKWSWDPDYGTDCRCIIDLSVNAHAYDSLRSDKFITAGRSTSELRIGFNPNQLNKFEIFGTASMFSAISVNNVASWKYYLSTNPLTVWYRSVDFYKSKGPFYYVHEVSDGTTSPYKAIGIELNAPLFDGDSLEIGGLSGFDQMVVLDGSEDEGWYAQNASNGLYRTKDNIANDMQFSSQTGNNAKSNYLRSIGASWADIKSGEFFTEALSYYVGVCISSITTLEAFKSYLSAHPLTVFYKSVNYTPENDIPVALESHVMGYVVFDGTENWTGPEGGFNRFVYDIKDTMQSAYRQECISNQGRFSVTSHEEFTCFISKRNFYYYPESSITNLTSFKAWVASQYSAGTPVQVVYELASSATYAHPIQPETIPAYYGTEGFVTALAGEDVTGKWLSFTNDGTQLNFKGGGGLTSSKLAAADAEPGEVLEGIKYFAGDKTLKTGTMPNQPNGNQCPIVTWYEDGFVFLPIPYGAYVTNGEKGYPYIKRRLREIISEAGYENAANYLPGGNQGAKTAALNAGGSYTIPQGWHNGSGKVTANSLASQTDANAAAGNILTGKTAWVKGSKIIGTMANRGAPNQTLGIGGSYSLSAGYYSGGKISAKGSFSGSGSGNKNGGETDIHRDGNNIVAKGYTVSSASASISGKTVTVNVHAHFRLNNNGNVNVPNGNLSSVDYSFSFNIG